MSRIAAMRGSPEPGKLSEPQYSSHSQSPFSVLIGNDGLVRKRLLLLASTLLIMVNGDPVSIKAVGTAGSGYSSVVHHTDGHLFKTARARVTFSRMSVALAVQMKGLGF